MRKLTTEDIATAAYHKKAIREFVEEAIKKHRKKIRKMILYGSIARGEANEESDIDVLVVWNGRTLDAVNALGEIAFRILLKYGCDISIHPMTPEHYKYVNEVKTSFIRNVQKEGILVA